MAELERTGAFDRSLLVLVSPTGTGYVNYVADAALQYLALGDVATVTLQYSRRPSPLSLGMIRTAREQNRLLWLRILERLRERPGPRPRVVLFGESLGAHTSQDVFLHWGTLGLDAMGIDRALWIGTPYGSKWMRQVTRGERLDVDRDAVAVVNDRAQLSGPGRAARLPAALRPAEPRQRRRDEVRPRPALVPPGVAGSLPAAPRTGRRRQPPRHPADHAVAAGDDLLPEPGRHEERAGGGGLPGVAARLPRGPPRFLSEVYGLPASPEQLLRLEEVLEVRETVRERLFAVVPGAVG